MIFGYPVPNDADVSMCAKTVRRLRALHRLRMLCRIGYLQYLYSARMTPVPLEFSFGAQGAGDHIRPSLHIYHTAVMQVWKFCKDLCNPSPSFSVGDSHLGIQGLGSFIEILDTYEAAVLFPLGNIHAASGAVPHDLLFP